MNYRLTILGCGSSGGVPRLGNDWGQCDPANPKNRRLRCAALIERRTREGATAVLVDTGPDVREQLLSVRLGHIDGVLFTHDHADHTHGLDDLRVLAYRMKKRINVWFDTETRDNLVARFRYCFEQPAGRSYPPIFTPHDIAFGTPIVIDGAGGAVTVLPVAQEHGEIASVGYRCGDIAYSPDISGLSEQSIEMLRGLDVWIVDALRYTPHPSHFTVKQALGWIERLKPQRAILTHLHVDLDYATLKRELPANVEPAYDGMTLEW